ncbi:hypothetical protein [Escherichia coli]|uniref:hypothetical protein n=1 Tax=Escherichia coli TaxID=562 RepID=UPI00202CE038|nr:hypothetical protein [Escherichia coli]
MPIYHVQNVGLFKQVAQILLQFLTFNVVFTILAIFKDIICLEECVRDISEATSAVRSF